MAPLPGWRRIAVGRKPKHVPNNREEIIKIIEKEKKMSYGHRGVVRTQEEKDMWDFEPVKFNIPKNYIYCVVTAILVWLGLSALSLCLALVSHEIEVHGIDYILYMYTYLLKERTFIMVVPPLLLTTLYIVRRK